MQLCVLSFQRTFRKQHKNLPVTPPIVAHLAPHTAILKFKLASKNCRGQMMWLKTSQQPGLCTISHVDNSDIVLRLQTIQIWCVQEKSVVDDCRGHCHGIGVTEQCEAVFHISID
jgi:hypothetical protein